MTQVWFVGRDATGKTSLIHGLTKGAVLHAPFPSLGILCEPLTAAHPSKRAGLLFTAPKALSINLWEVGGSEARSPLWRRHYLPNSKLIVYVLDGADHDRLPDFAEYYRDTCFGDDLREIPILFAVNKSDLKACLSVTQVVEALRIPEEEKRMSRKWDIMSVSATNLDSCKLLKDRICLMLDPDDSFPSAFELETKASAGSDSAALSLSTSCTSALAEEWIAFKDEDDVIFLEKFQNSDVLELDHRSFVRLIWLCLRFYDRKDAINRIFKTIQNHELVSEWGRNETYVYFWIQIVHFSSERSKAASSSYDKDHKEVLSSPFLEFILYNCHVCDTSLIYQYFSKERIAAGEKVVLTPDIMPLPSIVAAPEVSSVPVRDSKSLKKKLTDEEFLTKFREKSLESWSHESFVRTIWVYLKPALFKTSDRKLYDSSFDSLEASLKESLKDQFHSTLLFFWVNELQIAFFKDSPKSDVLFETLWESNPRLQNSLLHRDYFSDKLINSREAVENFVLPDKNPLPKSSIKL